MTAALALEQLLNGLQYGLMLFLISSGLTLVLGIMNTLNLTHGVLYMYGAFFAVQSYKYSDSALFAAVAAVGGVTALAAALEALVMRKLYQREQLDQVLATFGLLLFLTEAATMIWGRSALNIPMPPALTGSIQIIPGLQYPVYRLLIAAVALALAGGMYLLIQHTRIGIEIRAGAGNRLMLSCCGVNVGNLFLLVFCLGAALAGAAGMLVGPLVSIDAGMGDTILTLCVVVIAIGGLGSVRGALAAALAVGVVDTFGRTLLPGALGYPLGPALASVTVYAFMATALIVRPRGLFPMRS
jgi:branched-chain amino acid transport system permease protein